MHKNAIGFGYKEAQRQEAKKASGEGGIFHAIL